MPARPRSAAPPRETALYPPVKAFLEARGWQIKGEIGGCDVVGLRDGQVLAAELKRSVTLELLLQAVDRMRAADEVWLAVPGTRRGRDRDPRVMRLCSALGIGLLGIVGNTAQLLAEPGPTRPRTARGRRAALVREHAARRGDPTPGGSTRTPIMTAYRQQALLYATMLQAGPRRPRDLGQGARQVLYRNVYGWFVRIERGLYGLNDAGLAALARWPQQTGTE